MKADGVGVGVNLKTDATDVGGSGRVRVAFNINGVVKPKKKKKTQQIALDCKDTKQILTMTFNSNHRVHFYSRAKCRSSLFSAKTFKSTAVRQFKFIRYFTGERKKTVKKELTMMNICSYQ